MLPMAAIFGDGRVALMCLLLVVVLVLSLSPIHRVVGARSLAEEEDLELEAQLKILNKHPVKTIHTEWGDILDCIDIYQQPAFDNPLLKNHKIQMKPTSIPEIVRDVTSSETKNKTSSFRTPTEGCPEGTVPIRRTQKEDLIRAKSLSPRTIFGGPNNASAQYKDGVLYDVPGETFNGASADIDIYNPKVAKGQYSTAEIALESGPSDIYNGIHFGWMVNPQLYGDNLTRSFTYWTAEGGKRGCYNTLCSSFVQIHKKITPGSPLDVSTYEGTQYVLTAMVFQDIKTKDWWLVYEGNISVGYWPNSFFPLFAGGVQHIYWGGHVQAGGDGTSPQMGSGESPKDDFTKACFFANMKIVTKSNVQQNPREEKMNGRVGCPKYYGVKYFGYQKGMGHTLLFGGPGGKCA